LLLHPCSISRQQALHLLQNAIRRARRNIAPGLEEQETALLDARRFAIRIGDKLAERCKESVVVADLGPGFAYPRSVKQPGQNMLPDDQFHFTPELLAKHAPVAVMLGMDEQGGKQVYVLNVQPAAGAD